jgi:lipopolysaccharide exporter
MRLVKFNKASSDFSGNVLKLVTGATFAQALGILVSPIVTRLFVPESYGGAALFLSITSIIGVIVCLRYELAIMLPKTDEEAANVLAVSLCSVLVVTTLSATIVVWGGDYILHLLNAFELKKYLWLIPVSVFFSGISLSLNYWNSRKKNYGYLSMIQICSSVITQTSKLSAGFAGFVSSGALIVTSMIGSVITAVLLGGQSWRSGKQLFLSSVRWRGIFECFLRYRKFPLIDTWGGLLNTISWQLPALMLSSFFPLYVVGFYSLGLAVIMRPLNIVSSALAQVFYQKACDEKNFIGNNGELVEKLMDNLIVVGILPTMILAMIGPELFLVVFGEQWGEAGRYTQILSPWVFFWFISSPLSTMFSVYERQGIALYAHIIIFLTRIGSLYVGGMYQNIYLALGLFSLTGIAAYAFVMIWNIRLAQANGSKIFLKFIKYCVYYSPGALCIFLTKYIFHFGSISILLLVLVIITIYLYIFRDRLIPFLVVSHNKN